VAKGRRKKTKWKHEIKVERRGKKKKHERNKKARHLCFWRQIMGYLKLIFDRYTSNYFEFIIHLSLCIRRYII